MTVPSLPSARPAPARRSRLRRGTVVLAATALSLAGLGSTALGSAASGASGSGSSSAKPSGLRPAATQPTLASSVTARKATSSSIAQSSPGLAASTSTKAIPVMIKYDYDALASYTGTVSGYAATSPSVTGKPANTTDSASRRYLSYLAQQERSITTKVQAAAPSARITRSFKVAYGGVSAVVTGVSIKQILKVPGVVAVQRDVLNQPLDDASNAFINSGPAYAALQSKAKAGAGVLLGNLDTGVWPEHPALAARPDLPAGPSLPCNFGDNPLTPANDPFVCNNKLVGGQAFLATYDAVNGTTYSYPDTARDGEGHGSHTSTTSAGSIVNNVQTIGPVVPQVAGLAPGAQVSEYRVCATLGCFSSDSAAAVQQAILDGVDVINFSISGGADPATDPVELAFLDAYNAGVFVSASAGNSGPGAGTSDHAAPWEATVGASTQRREFDSTLTLTDGGGATFQATGASITAGASGPLVLASAAPYSDALCTTPAAPGTFAGKIVACQRGSNARVDKGFNVKQGGAAGMVLYNAALADVETDNHWLPAVHLPDGTAFLAFVGSHSNITASFTAGARANGQGDVMAAFSSRGPLGNFIKPDITAPGVQILAAMTPTPETPTDGPPGQYWQAIAGTSMSSPHIAGAALLVKAVHPTWTPGQIKSAIMTQATQSVVKEDGVTPADPFDMGAGRVNVGGAIKAPLTISDTAANMATLFDDPVHSIDLNIPSINAPTMPGRISTTRTVTNVTSGPLTVSPVATVPAQTKIRFSPRSATVGAGQSATFTITLESSAPVGSQQFAEVRFRSRGGIVHVPVAFVPQQGAVDLVQSCAAGTVQVGQTTTCSVSATNNSFSAQDVTLSTTTNPNLKLQGGPVSQTANLAGAQLGIPSMGPGSTPGGGFLDLALFGFQPVPIGDEQILNFNVPAFAYNGATDSVVGIDSNGYLVVGGGTSSDNECCNLPSGPSSAPPNNMMAPFWTDLDGTGAAGITAGTLTDGVNNWLIVQWDVNDFGTTNLRQFQVWIGIDGFQDVSYGYATAQADPGQPYLVGAENAAGQGDMQAILPSADIVISSTNPTPGGTLSYNVTVRGNQPGAGVVHSESTTTAVPGQTIVNTPVQVTP